MRFRLPRLRSPNTRDAHPYTLGNPLGRDEAMAVFRTDAAEEAILEGDVRRQKPAGFGCGLGCFWSFASEAAGSDRGGDHLRGGDAGDSCSMGRSPLPGKRGRSEEIFVTGHRKRNSRHRPHRARHTQPPDPRRSHLDVRGCNDRPHRDYHRHLCWYPQRLLRRAV